MADVTIRNPQPVPMLDFSRQFAVLRQEILDSIEAVCASQHFILGPQVDQLRARRRHRLRCPSRHWLRQRHRRHLARPRSRKHWPR